jgi:hypothetical protein
MAFVTEKDYSGRGEGGELTPQEEVFVQNLAAQCVYDSNKIVRLNSNNGGLANRVLKVDNTGNYLVWDSINWGEIAGSLSNQTDLQNALNSKVAGPNSATNNNIAVFDGTTGKLIKDGGKGLPSGAVVGDVDSQDLSNKNILTGENSQTGTSYTLALSDAGKCVTMNNASANTVTIPSNSSVAFPIGTKIMITQLGAGATTIAAGSGVTLNAPSSVSANINEQYGSRVIWKRATDTWLLV